MSFVAHNSRSCNRLGKPIGKDLGLEIKANLISRSHTFGGMRRVFPRTAPVVAGIKPGESKQLLDIGRRKRRQKT